MRLIARMPVLFENKDMIQLSPSQNRVAAAGITVLSFTVVLAFVLFVGWAVVRFISYASSAILPVIIGLFLSMLFKPYFNWWRTKARNPTLALAIMFVTILCPLVLTCWFGGALVVDQVVNLIRALPNVITRISEWVNLSYPNLQTTVAELGATADQMLFFTDPARFTREIVSQVTSSYGADALRAGASVLKYLTRLLSGLVAIIFFVYFLFQPDMHGKDYVKLLPFLKDETKGFVAAQIDAFIDIVVSFFQRQVVICLIEGVLYGLGFMLVGLPYGFVLGFLLGVLNLVPLMGSAMCLPLALSLAYFGDGGSTLRLIGATGVWTTGQILDNYLITPKIQGEKTGLGYAGVIFSFFFWGIIFESFLGLLLAIPLSAFCVVLWGAVKDRYIKGLF